MPSTEFEKVQEWEEVEVRGDEIVEEDEYRIDTVEDTKMVEVEELQTYTFKPEPAGDPEIIRCARATKAPQTLTLHANQIL